MYIMQKLDLIIVYLQSCDIREVSYTHKVLFPYLLLSNQTKFMKTLGFDCFLLVAKASIGTAVFLVILQSRSLHHLLFRTYSFSSILYKQVVAVSGFHFFHHPVHRNQISSFPSFLQLAN